MNRQIQKAKRRDRVARWGITAGGVLVVAAIAGIFFEITAVTVPLFLPAGAEAVARPSGEAGTKAGTVPAIVGLDEHMQTAFAVAATGAVRIHRLGDTHAPPGAHAAPLSSPAGTSAPIAHTRAFGTHYLVHWADGSLSLETFSFEPVFAVGEERRIAFSRERLRAATTYAGAATPPALQTAHFDPEEDRFTHVAVMPGGRVRVHQEVVESGLLGGGRTVRRQFDLAETVAGRPTDLLLDAPGKTLYVGTAAGTLYRWELGTGAGESVLHDRVSLPDGRGIVRLGWVLGEYSVVVADDRGGLSSWFPVRRKEGAATKSVRRIHDLPDHDAPVSAIVAMPLTKSLVTLDRAGRVRLSHNTSEQLLLDLDHGIPLRRVAVNDRGEGLIAADAAGNLVVYAIDNPHPEVSLGTLFGKVWYEGYDEPAFVWQSSSASSDFEPKLSLVPLIVGTFKATLYAMLFSIPLALLGAIYASQFLSDRLRKVVKPTVEMMAAFPSVVIGFLAALWFAPLLQGNVVMVFTLLATLPFTLMVWLFGWARLETRHPKLASRRGTEFLLLAPILVAGGWLAWVLAAPIESAIFSGDFQQWLFGEWGTRYDQRNSIVIAFALGFAVIPIIFTIADDALSNVPKSLTAASLALGASRWQTVWKIVLPSASPGVFAAIMIGFGRAVGETMIVLMAAGNTPILDWSLFNGMRTMSANIAVEIPEAPHGGTLYRVLFLSGLLLFVITFVANTAAEVVRNRLRERYGRF